MDTILLIFIVVFVGLGCFKLGELLASVAWRLGLEKYVERRIENWIEKNLK